MPLHVDQMFGSSTRRMTVKLLVNCVVKNWFIRRGTSNLREHLNRIHKKEYHPSTHVANQRTIENSFFSFVCGSCPESRAKRITELIVEMIAIDIRPLRLIDRIFSKAGFIINHLRSSLKCSSIPQQKLTTTFIKKH